VTEEAFGEGVNGPLLITADLPEGLDDDGVQEAQLTVARALAGMDDVVAVAPVAVSDDSRLAAFQVIPAEGPNSVSTERLVQDLRTSEPVDGEIELGVAGQAAINIDISEGLADVLPLYLAVVVGLSFLIMVMVFRSILVPLIATGGFVLSLFATYGAVTAVFQWGWLGELFGVHQPGPILSFLPVILVGILFGLAMDYQLFLATGMREAYAHGAPARLAVAEGFRAGRTVVIAAAIIMIAVFGGFITSESVIIKSMGLGLAAGVLFDAFVVRMLLVPAIMHLLGRSAWWLPRWLDRIVPNVDVEGAALERRHPVHH
jgi:putative drug exporter of the RND superfamily